MPDLKNHKITVFHCVNTVDEKLLQSCGDKLNAEIKCVPLPCSGLVKEVFLLRAFEAGADAVAVLVCPEDQCRHLQGSIRARKRVENTRKILDEVGLGGERLSIFNIRSREQLVVRKRLQEVASGLSDLGPIRVAA